MPTFSYSVADFLPFTKIISQDVNTRFSDLKTLLNTTGLDSTNVQQYGLTRDRLAKTSANQVVINDSQGAMTSEAQLALSRGGTAADLSSISGKAGQAIIVNNGETALQYGSPLQATLTESLSGVVSSLTSGVALTANDAACLDLGQDGSGNNIYRVFRCNSTLPNRRRNFLGLVQASTTVTPEIETWVASANFVASNVITYKINGRAYSTNFTTDNTTTLNAIATQMATDPDVAGAVSDGVHTITVTGQGGLFVNITTSVVTGGASQATITVTVTQQPSGQNAKVQVFGPFTGLSGLVVGSIYYLSSSTGAITATPTDSNPIAVGQAIDTTVLFINPNISNFQFSAPLTMVRSHGTSTGAAAGATQDVEHFNFTSWSAGTSAATGASIGNGTGNTAYNSFHNQIDGRNSSDTVAALHGKYNKVSWATATNTATAMDERAHAVYNNFLYACKGEINAGTAQTTNYKWNDTTWAVSTAFATALDSSGAFTTNSLLDVVGGYNGAAGQTTHETMNSSDVLGSATVVPAAAAVSFSGNQTTTLGITSAASNENTNTTASYSWNGTSWSSSLTAAYTAASGRNGTCGSCNQTVSNLFYTNGGATSTPTVTNATQRFNGTGYTSDTASTNSRSGSRGSAI